MKKSNFFNTLLTADIIYEKYSRNYRRLILLNVLLYIAILMTGFFSLFNLLQLQNYLVAGMDALAFLSLLYASYDVHVFKRLERAVNILIAISFVFLYSFALVNQNESFGLIWTIFFPIVSIVLLDRNKGLLFVLIFYLGLFYFALNGIGSWQSGYWDLASFLRFFAATFTLTYIIYFIEYSHELSEDQLETTRKKEAENMASLRELSIKDSLTKLYNRRHLNDVFAKEFQTAKRHKYYFGFFILDVDYFKQYNDLYGHQKGDDALCALANVLETHMRRSEDFVFRLGGEEFCGVCVSDDTSKIQAQLKVLAHAIESLAIEHKGSPISRFLTASIGVKIINVYDDYDFDRIYKEADEALYRAKKEGRNRIIFSY